MNEKLNILLVDDDEEEYILLKDMLRSSNDSGKRFSVSLDWISGYAEAVQAFENPKFDLFLIDYHLGEHTGLDLLREAAARGVDAPLILLTGQGNYEVDLAAMQMGAADYLVKADLTVPLLERSVRYALERKAARAELERLVQERTHELAQANQDLLSEIALRRQAEENIRAANEALEVRVAERTFELRQRAEELRALHSATAALLSTLDLNALLSQILDASLRAVPAAENTWLYLVPTHTRLLRPHSEDKPANGRYRDPRIRRLTIPGIPWIVQAVSWQKPVLVSDLRASPEYDPADPDQAELAEIRSLIVVPLQTGAQALGALSLGSGQPSVFSQGSLRLMETFAAATSAAIENAVLHAEVQQLATVDTLTGLYNRRSLDDLGQREIDRFYRFSRPLTVVMFDIDHFKVVNDTHGHRVGDEVLRELAERFQASIRHTDILGRYGGDEFVLLLPETDLFTAGQVADRICQVVKETPVSTSAGPVNLSVSLGVSRASRLTPDLTTLISRADTALYQAKQNGRGRVEVC